MAFKVSVDEEEFAALLGPIIERNVQRLREDILTNIKADQPMMTVAELAEYLRVSRDWVYKQAEKRSIPCYRLAGNIRFNKRVIDKWAEQHRQEDVPNNPAARILKSLHRPIEWNEDY